MSEFAPVGTYGSVNNHFFLLPLLLSHFYNLTQLGQLSATVCIIKTVIYGDRQFKMGRGRKGKSVARQSSKLKEKSKEMLQNMGVAEILQPICTCCLGDESESICGEGEIEQESYPHAA